MRKVVGWMVFLWLAVLLSPSLLAARQLMVWAVVREEGGSDLFFSQEEENGWSEPECLFSTPHLIRHPTVVGNREQMIWVAWQEVTPSQEFMWQRIRDRGRWQNQERLQLSAGGDEDPVLFVDSTDTVWLVWSGLEGNDREIFAASWLGERWGERKRLSHNPAGPDKHPLVIRAADGGLLVSWSGFDGSLYRHRKARLVGTHWELERDGDERKRQAYLSGLGKQSPVLPPAKLLGPVQLSLFSTATGIATPYVFNQKLSVQ